MKRYEDDMKAQAMARMEEIGVKRTGEELGISIQTLYKWRNEKKEDLMFRAAQPNVKMDEMLRLLKSDDTLEEKIIRLEAEILELRKINSQMRKALMSMLG